MRKNNRIFLLVIAFVLHCVPAFADDIEDRADNVFGDGFYPGYACVECRDPVDHPMDFAAFAYNEFFGDDPWLRNSRLGMPFRVYNLHLEYVAIWFERLLFDVPTLLPNLMDVRVRFEDGRVMTYTVIQGGPELPVGDQDRTSEACSCGGGDGDDGDDDYDYEEPDDYEYEEPERNGVVEIEDPDENDEFPDWEEEL